MDVVCNDHVVDQHSINSHADHDQETLERKGKQRLEIVVADAAPLAVGHGCHGDRCNAHGAVNFNHSSIQDDRDKNGHDFEAKADQHGFNG